MLRKSGGLVRQARQKELTSDEHLTVDGTLLEASASVKSLQRRHVKNPPSSDDPGNPTLNFHDEKRSNRTTTEDRSGGEDCRQGEGKDAKLSYSGNLLVKNRNGLIVNAMVWEATSTAERDTALLMLERIPGNRRVTVAGDKGFDTADFISECRHMQVTSHVVQNHGRRGRKATALANQNGADRGMPSDGLGRSPCCARYGIMGCSRWIGCLPSLARSITWCVCGSY